ncbi:MAG: hypothetical protein WKG06_43380 [Segetibacter sp.]
MAEFMQIIEKQISNTIRTLESFFSVCYYEVMSSHRTLDKAVAKTQKKDEGFHFEFTKMEMTSQDERHKITYATNVPIKFSNSYTTIGFNLSDCKYTFSVGFSGHTSLSGYLKEFATTALENHANCYYRAVVICKLDHALSGYFFHNNTLQIGTTSYGSGVLEICINGINLHLFSYTSKETRKSYFVIESQNVVPYTDFKSIQDEIILALTYLTGTFLGKEIYIVGSDTNNFENNVILSLNRFFDDLKNSYPAIPDVNLQHQVNAPVQRCAIKYLEGLIHELLNSLVYKRAVLLICQAHTEPPYVMSTLYSVALETITNKISEKLTDKIKPIDNRELSSKIRNELKKTLLPFKDRLSALAYAKIESDIDRINSPTNKQKLLVPFKYFKIALAPKDIEAIEKRNDFLHGRIPEENDKHYLSIINGRLLFCINCLVLKHIGFSGYLIYYPSVYQLNNNLRIEEGLIRKI